jgi:hypothetical protein
MIDSSLSASINHHPCYQLYCHLDVSLPPIRCWIDVAFGLLVNVELIMDSLWSLSWSWTACNMLTMLVSSTIPPMTFLLFVTMEKKNGGVRERKGEDYEKEIAARHFEI